MDLKEIVSIGGIGGLHKIIGQRSSGLIVETLDESKKRFPTTLSQKVSVLEDISMYTSEGETRLKEVMLSIYGQEEKGLTVPDKKGDEASFRAFMEAALPNYDKERVYISDIRKLAQWYLLLKPLLDWESLKKSDEEAAGSKDAGDKENAEVKKTGVKKAAGKSPAAAKVKAIKPANVKTQNNAPRKTGGA
jgi:hypothetical protein